MTKIRNMMGLSGLPLVVITGPTASGKTAVALDIARQINGEIICADSRTVYKHMDIGTAKPSSAERIQIPHHLLDLIQPNEHLSVGEFQDLAEAAIENIWKRGHVPMLVGGSGLYLDSVLYSFDFPPAADPVVRSKYNDMTLDELVVELRRASPERSETIDLKNKRRVVRALETQAVGTGRRFDLLPGTLVIGMALNKDVARDRIAKRVELMLSQGFVEEVTYIGETYDWDCAAFNVIGYRAFAPVVQGLESIEVGTEHFIRGDLALYKKQMTWFKKNLDIKWVENPQAAQVLAQAYIANLKGIL